MNPFINYLMQAGLALILFYLPYRWLLHRDTHFTFNRVVLLLSMLVSMILPLIRLNLEQKLPAAIPSFYLDLNATVTSAKVTAPAHTNWFRSIWQILETIYIAGALIVLARLIYQTIYLHAMSRLSKIIRRGNLTIVLINADITPFSYFNRIYIPLSEANSEAFESIIAHEQAHLKQKHFYDLFLIEVLTVVQWFNPIVWLYEHSLKEIQEYLADKVVLSHGHDRGKYQALLVNQAVGGQVFTLTNQFNQSLIKKRFIMMTKMRTPKMAQLKVLLFFPVAAALLMAFANPKPIAQKAKQSFKTAFPALAQKTLGSKNLTENSEPSMPINTLETSAAKDTTKNKLIFQTVEQMPQYPGGVKALETFISANLRYPAEAVKNNIEGRVYLRFIVNKEGNILEPTIIRGIGGGCDDEAIRVVKMFPQWSPGYQNGKAVDVYFTLPILFSFNEKETTSSPKVTVTGYTEQEKSSTAQTGKHVLALDEVSVKQASTSEKIETETTYAQTEQMPSYPGGIEALINFLKANLKYPEGATKAKIEGKVFVKFIVNKEGEIINPKVLRGIGGGCNEEAIRVVSLMPKWQPGYQNGKPVNVYFTLPILFKLTN